MRLFVITLTYFGMVKNKQKFKKVVIDQFQGIF